MMGATTNEDWIDDLFSDDLAKWRSYLQSQMDFVKMDTPLWEAVWTGIETGDFADLYRLSQIIADHLDTPDPRRQFLERIKLM